MGQVGSTAVAKQVSKRCFESGLIIERCGRDDETLKILPPLNIKEEQLIKGLKILAKAIDETVAEENLSKTTTRALTAPLP